MLVFLLAVAATADSCCVAVLYDTPLHRYGKKRYELLAVRPVSCSNYMYGDHVEFFNIKPRG